MPKFEADETVCSECGAVCDYVAGVPDDLQVCNQCACCYAATCEACGGPCRGRAWPVNYIPPRAVYQRR